MLLTSQALVETIKSSKAATMGELTADLKKDTTTLIENVRSPVPAFAGCELFLRYITNTINIEVSRFLS